MHKLIPALVGALLLAACSATPFQPTNPNGYGYADQQVSADVYTVVFIANTATPVQQVHDYALLRAAEIGAAQGYTYLTVEQDKSGNIMVAPRRTGSVDMLDDSRDEQSSRDMGVMGMSGGSGGAYGGNGASYSVGGGSPGTPARACALMLHFSKQEGAEGGKTRQDIQALLAKFRAEYGLPRGH